MNNKNIIIGLCSLLGVAAYIAFNLNSDMDTVSQNTNTVYAALQSVEEKTDDVSAAIEDGKTDESSDSISDTGEKIYGIGSVSKVYVTTAVMQLVDQGKVELDMPVTEYIADFKMEDERYKDITVRMLMNHTSGIMGSSLANMQLYSEVEYVGLGEIVYHLNCGERIAPVEVEKDALEAWCRLNDECAVLYNDKYSSEYYDIPFQIIKTSDDMMGYISIGEPGKSSDLLKIDSSNKAVAFSTIPSSASRDIYDISVEKEELKAGNEITSINATHGGKYRLVSELPILDLSVKTVDLYTDEASWFRIGDDIAGGTLSVDRPKNSNIYVYNKYNEVVYSTHMHIDVDIPLPAGGYIAFLGETGGKIIVE